MSETTVNENANTNDSENKVSHIADVIHSFTHKWLEVSTDYEKLWNLIQQGNRIPAWVLYSDKYEEPIWDIVEVKLGYKSDRYSIGHRGMGYESWRDNNMETFAENCKFYCLHYVVGKIGL